MRHRNCILPWPNHVRPNLLPIHQHDVDKKDRRWCWWPVTVPVFVDFCVPASSCSCNRLAQVTQHAILWKQNKNNTSLLSFLFPNIGYDDFFGGNIFRGSHNQIIKSRDLTYNLGTSFMPGPKHTVNTSDKWFWRLRRWGNDQANKGLWDIVGKDSRFRG